MPILPRETSARRYLLGSGLWFVFWALFVGISAAVVGAPDPVYRGMWLLLAALLLGRGVQQLVRARKAPRETAAPATPGAPADPAASNAEGRRSGA